MNNAEQSGAYVVNAIDRLVDIAESVREARERLFESEALVQRAIIGLKADRLIDQSRASVSVNETIITRAALLKVADLQREFGVSRNTIYRMDREGRLPPSVEPPGSRRAWRRSDIDAWLEKRGRI